MPSPRPERRYLATWLKRTGKELSVSGRISQVAVILSSEQGGSPEEWRDRLHNILRGQEIPSLNLLTHIDSILAPPAKPASPPDEQDSLF